MKKILIVDDRQEIRELGEMTLNKESRSVDRIGKTFPTQPILEIKTEVDKAT
jgi:DNA-binding NtrC family response regulator